MTKQIWLVACAVCIASLLPISAPAAQAIECLAALSSNPQKHWTYRLVDGRKCWYQGKHMISRSLLKWPSRAPAVQVDARKAPVSAIREKPGDLLDAQASIPDADSFEARWRARAMRD
jgi:hypothetical protein